jgi:hypothetical protein
MKIIKSVVRVKMDQRETKLLWGILYKWFKAPKGEEGKGLIADEVEAYINDLLARAYALGTLEGEDEG